VSNDPNRPFDPNAPGATALAPTGTSSAYGAPAPAPAPHAYPPAPYGQAYAPAPHYHGHPPPGAYPNAMPQPVNIVVQNTMTQTAAGSGLVRVNNRSKGTAAILALFLGGLGVHKFYLGRSGMGIVYLLFCWTFIPAMVAFIEFFLLLFMNDHDFDLRYNTALSR
jgi:TM2 domain-containing membrane protein YozV